jgi:signal transduction histidine kinase/HAMP domain-containing protein
MAQLNLGIFALVGVIMLVLAGASFGYLLRIQDKSLGSRLLMWFFLFVCGSAVAIILTNLGTDWARGFAFLQDALLIVGGIFLVRFAYVYPVNDQPQEARIVIAIYTGVAMIALSYAVYFVLYYLVSLPMQLSENRAYYLLTPLVIAFLVTLFFRRFLHWRHLSRAGTDPLPTAPSKQQLDRAACRRAASALRDFGIALALGLIPVLVTVLPDYWPFVRGTFLSFLFNFSVVLAISALMLVYLSHAPDPTTISARLVGISLATVLLLLGLVSVLVVLSTPGEQVSEMVLTFILLALGSSTFVLLIFPRFFRYTLLEPLERLLAGVRAADEGNLAVQVAVKHQDEIGSLTRSFNRMVSTLNEQSLILTDTTHYLEQQVGERTTALEEANVELQRQNFYQQALFRCSSVLLSPAASEAERVQLLNQALAHLMQAVEASRAYLFKNRLDPVDGEEIMSMQAEAVAPGVHPHLPQQENQYFPWSRFPAEIHHALRNGLPSGGPVEQTFASHPELREAFLSQQPPLLSAMLFPVQVEGAWWGYIGFDDCWQPRQWNEQEIQLLRTGAGMLSSVLQRWQQEDQNRQQEVAQRTLAQASRLLLQPVGSEQERTGALAAALDLLVSAAGASRGFLFKNQELPDNGFGLQLVVEASTPDVSAHLGGPLAGHIPWNLLPEATRTALEHGQPASGPVEEVLGGSSEMLDVLDADPMLSVLFYSIHFGNHWWGLVGFDDIESVRSWGDHERRLLRTGADIFSQTLSRWEARDQLRQTLSTLDEQVQQRTHQLSRSNARLLEEIDERKAAQKSLENRLEMEATLASISQALMVARDFPAAISQSLAGLGQLLEARRVSLFLLEEHPANGSRDRYSWQVQGVPAISLDQAQRYRQLFTRYAGLPEQLQPVYIKMDESMPALEQEEQLGPQDREINNLLLVPLVAQNERIGVLVCENIHVSAEEFDETRQMLEVAAGILGSALAHQQLLDELERKINTRSHELATLYDLAILGGRSERLSDVLQPMLGRVVEITASQAASVHLVDEDQLRLAVQLGLNTRQLSQQAVVPLTGALQGWLDREDEPLSGFQTAEPAQLAVFTLVNYPHLHLVRLRARARSHGVLCCYRQGADPYTPHQFSTLAAIGEQLGLIIENFRLRQEAEALAGLRERQRLARELHDSVSQSLYSLTLFARAGQDALGSENLEKLDQSLSEIEASSIDALREMRLLLYELRSEAVERGLRQALADRFQLVEHRLGIRTELEIADDLTLEPAVEQEIFRLVSEALNNSLKYAEAGQVSVRLRQEGSELQLQVVDDGCGFDLQQARAGLGLDSMRARAELLGGSLEIVSQPGAGTNIRLVCPAEIQLVGG